MSDDAADAGSDGERHSDPRLHVRTDRGARNGHVDHKATAGAAIGEGQSRMRACRDDARLLPAVGQTGILLLLFQPGELAYELLTHPGGHGEFEQKAAGSGVADLAFELTETAEIGCDVIPDLADHRHSDQHPER